MKKADFKLRLRDGATATVAVTVAVDPPDDRRAEDLANLLGGYLAGSCAEILADCRVLQIRSTRATAEETRAEEAPSPALPRSTGRGSEGGDHADD